MLIRRSFSLDSERDAALIAWLDRQDNVSEAVRAALREHLEQPRITLAEVYAAVQMLAEQLDSVRVDHLQTTSSISEEDPELAPALDQLGL